MHHATLLALLLCVTACGPESDTSGPDLRPAPVRLTTDAERYVSGTPGVLHVENLGTALWHGVCPNLERRRGERWATVESAGCVALALLLGPD